MWKKVLIGLVGLVVVLFVAGYFYGGSLVKGSVEKYGPRYTGTTVQLADVNFSPIGGSAGISGLVIGSPEGFDAEKTFSLGDVTVNFETATLLSDKVHIKEVIITEPEVNVEYKKGKLNIKALADKLNQYSSGEETTTLVVIDDLYITGGRVNVLGLPVGEQNQEFILPDIHLQNLGNATGDEEGTTFVNATETTIQAVSGAVTTLMAEKNIREFIEGGKKSVKDKVKGFLGLGGDDEEEDEGGN